ncbi:Y-family DNA polymerase [Mucilaginibacter terrae]|uniref:Y-family DNA polymerase n=1 Tax=Mucilaginibacter terrae TaxID=1955052 RepID=UPI00363A1DA1
MDKRFMALWFYRLKTDWMILRKPELAKIPFVFAMPDHNRVVITALNALAEAQGLQVGMRVADAKAMTPALKVLNDSLGREEKLLRAIAEWCIRYTPNVAIDLPDGLIFNISGCAHLWGGEAAYRNEIVKKFKAKGYVVKAAIADTVGAAWAVARFGRSGSIIPTKEHKAALMPLPPAALRLDANILERLQKLGFYRIEALQKIPRGELRRRFGDGLILRLMQAMGELEEYIAVIKEPEPYHERLPSLEPIRTRPGIEIAIRELLEMLTKRLSSEGKGIRTATLTTYRIDGKVQQVTIGTNKATHVVEHLFKLFELHIGEIEPDLGIELFVMDAPKVEDVDVTQQAIWAGKPGLQDSGIAELLDRLSGKVGAQSIHRYLPQERYWPERSIKAAKNIQDKPQSFWRSDMERPTQLLPKPQIIQVSAPIPDDPPMLFRYKNEVHHIKRADGPERIEREWWLDVGEHRDYYIVEDQQGFRYWVFRSGHYGQQQTQWFLHGYFA